MNFFLRMLAIGLFLSFAVTGCKQQATSNVVQGPSPTPAVAFDEMVNPDSAGTKPTYFESIDERAKSARMPTLRNSVLDPEDLEVRIWMGFGLTTLEGYVFKRVKGSWTGLRLYEDYFKETDKFRSQTANLVIPNVGWDEFWRFLLHKHILSLPDGDVSGCSRLMEDGYSYVFEIRKGKNYRTYTYKNPDEKCIETADIMAIESAILDNFNLRVRE